MTLPKPAFPLRRKNPPPIPRVPPLLRPSTRDWRYLSPGELKKLKNLLFAARLIVEGAYTGRHRSPYKGRSPEFVDYREYNPGDEIRSIDWKAYARTDRHFIKLFQKETDLNCYVFVDRSASMDYGGRKYQWAFKNDAVSKMDYAFHLAAALAYLMVKQGDKVALGLFDEKLDPYLPPGGTFAHLYNILNTLEKQKPGKSTSVSRVLREAQGLCKRRGLLIVISDLLDEPAEVFAALNMYRHRNFEVILFHVLHQYEHQLPPLDNIQFVDAETRESIQSQPAEIRAEYDREMAKFIQTMSALARSRNIDYNFTTTETPYGMLLEKYLLRRNSL